ncbi:RDD family protein [Ureibacillus aquaedulcis]|uniref:RDD family protein n=1 Tax=Ureibacillus aquaedulcis TaxID=3058421 RepID=A0ABT8GPY4_9BACL|nr:RDD family protein [Ureibacillus sp. BA0131]MDN4493470.1 RDD family protein [Ureibacillus sp. BA0131]
MKAITKKRRNAFLIDLAISGAVNAGVEYLLRKKIKNEAFHALVTPTAVLWTLEYVQLRKSGQTLGYKAAGLVMENASGADITPAQIVKRMAYRDLIGTVDYVFRRKSFEGQNGEILPHDRVAGTVVKEVK